MKLVGKPVKIRNYRVFQVKVRESRGLVDLLASIFKLQNMCKCLHFSGHLWKFKTDISIIVDGFRETYLFSLKDLANPNHEL